MDSSRDCEFTLCYLGTCMHLSVDCESLPLLQPVLDFFASHFNIDSGLAGRSDVEVTVRPYSEFRRADFGAADFSPLTIRESSAPQFNLYGVRALLPGLEIVDSANTRTAVVFVFDERAVRLYISEDSRIQAIELIRDLFIKSEERRGTLILHAAAAARNGKAVALVGSKGAGKSTILLELISRWGLNLLSGDKLFLRLEDGRVRAYGWPDVPHLGYHTILSHPSLLAAVEALGHHITPETPGKKLLLAPEVLRRALGFSYAREGATISSIILPNVQNGGESMRLVDGLDSELILRHLEFSSENRFASWHSFISPMPRTGSQANIRNLEMMLADCRCYELGGPGDLTQTQVEALL